MAQDNIVRINFILSQADRRVFITKWKQLIHLYQITWTWVQYVPTCLNSHCTQCINSHCTQLMTWVRYVPTCINSHCTQLITWVRYVPTCLNSHCTQLITWVRYVPTCINSHCTQLMYSRTHHAPSYSRHVIFSPNLLSNTLPYWAKKAVVLTAIWLAN